MLERHTETTRRDALFPAAVKGSRHTFLSPTKIALRRHVHTEEKSRIHTIPDALDLIPAYKFRMMNTKAYDGSGENSMVRTDKENYYLDIAETVLERGTCLRRNYGAIIVCNDEIVSTGYNGAPRGRANCIDAGVCIREKLGIPRGERYEVCRSVHAEANAIISASRKEMLGATLYLVGRDARTGEYVQNASSCSMCKRMVINAGIARVVIRDTRTQYRVVEVTDWVKNDESLEGLFGY